MLGFERGGVLPSFAGGGVLYGPSHAGGGIPTRYGELEGGEAVINKRSTAMHAGLLSRINQDGGGSSFAAGGVLQGPLGLGPHTAGKKLSGGVIGHLLQTAAIYGGKKATGPLAEMMGGASGKGYGNSWMNDDLLSTASNLSLGLELASIALPSMYTATSRRMDWKILEKPSTT